jgi:Na+/proline symporter
LLKPATTPDTLPVTALAASLAAFIPLLIALVTTFVALEAEGRGGISGMVVGTVAPLYVVIPTEVNMKTARTNIIT